MSDDEEEPTPPAPPAPPEPDPLLPVVRGIEADGVVAAPPLADAEAGAVAAPEANEDRMAELAEAASATGQTVVVRAITSVTTTPADAEFLAGQLVTVAAQLVIVWIEVV